MRQKKEYQKKWTIYGKIKKIKKLNIKMNFKEQDCDKKWAKEEVIEKQVEK